MRWGTASRSSAITIGAITALNAISSPPASTAVSEASEVQPRKRSNAVYRITERSLDERPSASAPRNARTAVLSPCSIGCPVPKSVAKESAAVNSTSRNPSPSINETVPRLESRWTDLHSPAGAELLPKLVGAEHQGDVGRVLEVRLADHPGPAGARLPVVGRHEPVQPQDPPTPSSQMEGRRAAHGAQPNHDSVGAGSRHQEYASPSCLLARKSS